MDGLQKWVRSSLRIRLSVWLSAGIVMVAMLAGIFAFLSGFWEAHQFQDDVLRQVAAMFDPKHPMAFSPVDAVGAEVSDPESRIFMQRVPATGTVEGAPLALPGHLHPGFQTARIGHEPYRIWVRSLADGGSLVVAQETAVRDEIARNSAFRTVLPFLILVPLLLLLVAELVVRVFRPVVRLAQEVDLRSDQELQPIVPDPLPAEIKSFVGAINRLLRRVEQSMDTQRRFVADAAHELRSPLTALSLQAERLAGAPMSALARERLLTLRQGIERGRTLVDQLLSLARAQASAGPPAAPVSIMKVCRRVLEELQPQAEAKGIDLGVEAATEVSVSAPEVDLFTLVKNLVDNAIRYTPAGGRVDLSIRAQPDWGILVVEDNGPGIPAAERARVFDPFYRLLGSDQIGSGLGLSIVQTITTRVGGWIRLDEAEHAEGSGLSATVAIPQWRERRP